VQNGEEGQDVPVGQDAGINPFLLYDARHIRLPLSPLRIFDGPSEKGVPRKDFTGRHRIAFPEES